MKRKFWIRLVSILLCVVLVLGLLASGLVVLTSGAAGVTETETETGVGTSEETVETEVTEDPIAFTYNGYEWRTPKTPTVEGISADSIRDILTSVSTQVATAASGDSLSVSDMMPTYVKGLVALDWAVNNIYRVGLGSYENDEDVYESMANGSMVYDIVSPIEDLDLTSSSTMSVISTNLQSFIDNMKALRDRINDKLSSTEESGYLTGVFGAYEIDASGVSDTTVLYGTSEFFTDLKNVIENYYAKHLLVDANKVINYNDVDLNTDIQTLSDNVTNYVKSVLQQNSNMTEEGVYYDIFQSMKKNNEYDAKMVELLLDYVATIGQYSGYVLALDVQAVQVDITDNSTPNKWYKVPAYCNRRSSSDVIPTVVQTLVTNATYNENNSNGSNVGDSITEGTVSTEGTEVVSNLITGGVATDTGIAVDNGTGTITSVETSELDLTDLSYVFLACGVVYEPFISIAGGTEFQETVMRFVTASEQDNVKTILQKAISSKKPLFYIDKSASEWWGNETELTKIPVATYQPATLDSMLVDGVDVSRAYFMLTGTMSPSNVDSSTYVYSHNSASVSAFDTSTDGATTSTTEVVGGYESTSAMTVTPSNSEITVSDEEVTRPVAFVSGRAKKFASTSGSAYYCGIGGLTTMILQNAYLDQKSNSKLATASSELLYMNGLGDIVLSDNTVILPAIANPILWNYPDESKTYYTDYDLMAIDWIGGVLGKLITLPDSLAETNPISSAIEQIVGLFEDNDNYRLVTQQIGMLPSESGENYGKSGYYPYNAAFLNSFPTIIVNSEKRIKSSDSTNLGKYVLNVSDTICTAIPISEIDDESVITALRDMEVRALPIASLSFNPTGVPDNAVSMFKIGLCTTETGILSWGNNTSALLAQFTSAMNSKYQPFFPLHLDDQDFLEEYTDKSAAVALSCIEYISTSMASGGRTQADTFNYDLWINDFMGQAMLGTQYAELISKNYKVDYEELVEGQYNRFVNLIVEAVSSFLENLGKIDGVLAMKDGYSNTFFNTIMSFVQEYYVIIVVMILVIVGVKFLRGRFTLTYIVVMLCLTFAAFQVYACWMPTALPALYNFFVNDIVEDIVWSVVTVNAESYTTTYADSDRVDSDGNIHPYTSTITLYKLTDAEMEEIAGRVSSDLSEIKSGKMIMLDASAGIYVQGDQIKMSVDKLLTNNTMRGLYESQWKQVNYGEDITVISEQTNDNPYIIKLTSAYVSLESYYTPFCEIERSFLRNINDFVNIFRVSRITYSYGSGVYKDGFAFNAFTSSGIFLAPNDDTMLLGNIDIDSIEGSTFATSNDILELIHQELDPQEDWLNLIPMFEEPSITMQNSLWGRMMQRQGYYDEDWELTTWGKNKLSELVYYINTQTKQWVVNNAEQIQWCSDENAIKLTSLYATTCFTNFVSEFGYWLYPNYINAADIELTDVLYGAMTSVKDHNISTNGDIINTVLLYQGLPGLLMIFMIIVFSVIFIFVLTYLIPVLYAMLGVIAMYSILNDESGVGLVKGYAKVTGVTILLYMLYSVGLRIVKIVGYKWYGFLFCMLITILCVYFMFFVVMSVISNPMQLGNETLARNLFGALDKLTGHTLSRITSNRVEVHNRNGHVFGNFGLGSASPFRRHAPVDNRYNPRQPSRASAGYYSRSSSYDDIDDGYNPRWARRFGNYFDRSEQTNRGFTRTRVGFGRRNRDNSRVTQTQSEETTTTSSDSNTESS